MAGDDHNFTIWGFIKGFGKLLIGLLLLLQGLIGLVMLILFVGVAISISNNMAGGEDGTSLTVQEGSALLIDPNGVLVEQAAPIDPIEEAFEEAYGIDEPRQIEAGDIIAALRKAKDDDRIKGVVLELSELAVPSSSASKLHDVAAAIDEFKTSGKTVVAMADYFGQEQYLLAAHANEVYLHDFGNVLLYGYGAYGAYIKSFLEKIKVTSHVFRVGTFKSAVEPFLRDDMSPEAKEANLAYLNVLWDEYAASVEKARGLPSGAVKGYAEGLGGQLRAAGGDFATAAVNAGLVDGLKSRPERIAYLNEMFGTGRDGKTFRHVGFRRYLMEIEEDKDTSAPNIAVVTAAGTIVDGEAPIGEAAGGDTVAGYLKQALEDENVKAVVLRVDSPGGSAFASEIIRDAVLAIKAAGKPVVVSMGSAAASGGYWIAAAGDEIFAAPTTITGSIGIFGFFPTFENAANELGVYVDGVGTTSLSPILATGIGPLPDEAADLFQQSVEEGYERFLKVVAEGRGLDPAYVDSIGQGRVWIGSTALDLKLVDKLGGLDEAVASAAARAGLESYDVIEIVDRQTPFERLFGISAHAMAALGVGERDARAATDLVSSFVAAARDQFEFVASFNDPNGIYARCVACEMK